MIPKYQAHSRRVEGSFSFFLCRIVFLLFMLLIPARGGDKARMPQVTLSANATTYQLAVGWNLISVNLELDVASNALL